MGTVASILSCPSDIAERWWLCLERSDYLVQPNSRKIKLGNVETVTDIGGTVSREGVTVALSIFRGSQHTDALVGLGKHFIRIDLIPYPPAQGTAKQIYNLGAQITRILVASGAQSLGTTCGFKEIVVCTEDLKKNAAYYLRIADSFIDVRRENALHDEVRRGNARVTIYTGYGLDYENQTPSPFIAIDYHFPLFRSKCATLKLAGDIIELLEGKGARKIN